MIRKSVLAASIAALLTPAVASALGLGNIEVTSALNEPLQARIPLRGADPAQLEELRVALADDQQFERAGLDRVYVLTKLRFKVVEAGSGSGFISISTREPVSEPFLNFLVDVNWPRGRVLREYTVLLDPPVYGAAIRTGTERKIRTVDSPPASSPPPPAARTAPAPMSRASVPMVAAPTQGAPRYTGDRYGPVRQGETLWSIADRTRSDGTSIQSMMLALLRANPEAFSLDNVNALRTGAVLRIPSASEVTGGKAAALEEVARQHALWAEYRQSTSGSVSPQPEGAPSSSTPAASATGSGSPAAASTTGGESSSELKLVGAGTSGAVTGGGADVEALRNDLTMAQEEADAAKLENQELQSRLTEVESLVGDLQRLVELKEDQLAALQDQLAKAGEQAAQQPAAAPPASGAEPKMSDPAPKVAPAETAAAPEQPATAAKAPEKPPAAKAKKRRAPPPPPPPPRSMMDDINDMLPVPLWTILAGLGAVLLGFGGLRFARGRKAKAAAVAEDVPVVADDESMIERFARTELPEDAGDDDVTELPAAPSPDSATLVEEADKTDLGATARSTAPATGDEEDPLAEVNVYLAYERFDQAEQLVRDAISTYPDRHGYKLKLLEVFYAAKNLVAFETAAGDLSGAVGGDHDMMQQAREWWADLGAGRELFSDDSGPSTQKGPGAADSSDDVLFDVTAAEAGEETGVDFDLSFDAGDGSDSQDSARLDFDLGGDDAAVPTPDNDGLDFDLGSLGGAAAAATAVAAVGGAAAAASDDSELDFDLGFGDDTPAAEEGSLDFDLGSDMEVSPDAVTAQAPRVERAPAPDDGETGLDFDLGSMDEEIASAPDTDGAGDSVLDFDLGDTAGMATGDGSAAGTLQDEVGAGSDLDFDLGDTQSIDGVVPAASEAPGATDGGGELDFDLGDTIPEVPQVTGSDSALDFDLGDTGPGTGQDTPADSALDFDLGDTGPGAGQDTPADSALDFDLGDTGPGAGQDTPADSALDFDLGDTSPGTGQDTPADSALDFDLGDTSPGTGQDTPADSALDFDLGDTGPGTGQDTPAESALDFDLGDTGPGTGQDTPADSALDFDLGDTGPGTGQDTPAESALDFDLGDTGPGTGQDTPADSALDFDLGDTGPGTGQDTPADSALDFDLGDTSPGVAGDTPEDSVLDFDLGDTSPGMPGDTPADSVLDFDSGDTSPGVAGDASEDSVLDFDLGDTQETGEAPVARASDGTGIGTASDADLDFDLSETLGPDAGGTSVDPDAELDFDLGDTASGAVTETRAGDAAEDLGLDLDLGAGLEDSGDAALSADAPALDLSLEMGEITGGGDVPSLDAGTGDGLPELDLDDGETPAFDTVQLAPDVAATLRDNAESAAGVGSEFGVDTEFRGIFSSADDAGSDSVLDFDLGSADLGASADDSEPPELSDLESTQFMLQDVPIDDGQDEDDNTLVLGRGASGEVDEIQTKLDLAQAYMDMGDTEGARNLLGEVMADGDDPQKEQAGEMLKKLS